MTTTELQVVERLPRDTIIELLVERDGTTCMYPGCNKELRLDIIDPSDSKFVTIDHWMPKHHMLEQGKTWEEIWDLDNLKLMEKACNARKGERVPNEDGTLPDRPVKTFRSRRAKRVGRPEICTECNAGRDLGKDEICAACQTGPAPLRLPRYHKAEVGKCDHATTWCGWCSIGIIPRASALEMLMLHGEGGE